MMGALVGSRGDQMAQIVYHIVILIILLKESITFNSSNTTKETQNELETLESHKKVFERELTMFNPFIFSSYAKEM